MAGEAAGGARAAPRPWSAALDIFRGRPEAGALGATVAIFVLFSVWADNFVSVDSFSSTMNIAAELGIVAMAVTLLMIAGEFDLSVGSVLGISSVLVPYLYQEMALQAGSAVLIAFVAAALTGVVNGTIVIRTRIPSFIVTLGMLYIVRGAALKMSAYPVARLRHPTFYDVLGGEIAGIPVQIFWMLGIVAVGTLVYRRTTYGYYVRATGSNEVAAQLAGIPVKRVKVIAFVLTSVLAAFAGALSFAHLTSVAPTAGAGDELTVIAAVVIGGTSLFGGQGTVIGTFLGAALLTVVRNGLVQIGGEGRLQEAFLGGIIILAVLIHTHVGRRR